VGIKWNPLSTILRSGDKLDDNIYYYRESDAGRRVSEILNEKKRTVRDTEFSYRVINNWESAGLIDNNRPSGKGWRKFSIMDVVWMGIIGQLRKFGFSLENILQAKESLSGTMESDQDGYSWLEYFVVASLVNKSPVVIMVSDTGNAEPAFFDEYVVNMTTIGLQSHVHINLNTILQEMYPDKDLSPVFGDMRQLSDEEKELFVLIRTGDYEQLTVKQKDGRIELIEGTQTEKIDERITDILSKGEWQNISLKQRDGKIVTIKRTVQIKAKKGGKRK